MSIKQQYEQAGFYIAKNILIHADIISVVASLKVTFDDQLIFLGLPPQQDLYASMKLLHHNDLERYQKTVGALWRKLSVYNLLHHQKIQAFVKQYFSWNEIMLPGGQVVLIMADSLKIPGGYFGLNVHQDFPSVQGSLDGFVVWIPLVDIDKKCYPMEVIPHSHTRGILPSFEHIDSNWIVRPEAYKEKDFIPVECGIGDVVFMSNFTVHRSSTTGDDRLRLACSTRYDNAKEKTFVERTYPTAYLRSVHRGLFDSTMVLMEKK